MSHFHFSGSLYIDTHTHTQALERKGNLRHIRISNEGDFVPVAPFWGGYRQAGLNIFLRKKKPLKAGYPNARSTISQVRWWRKMITAHSLSEYEHRLTLDCNAKELRSKTVEDFYNEYVPGINDKNKVNTE